MYSYECQKYITIAVVSSRSGLPISAETEGDDFTTFGRWGSVEKSERDVIGG